MNRNRLWNRIVLGGRGAGIALIASALLVGGICHAETPFVPENVKHLSVFSFGSGISTSLAMDDFGNPHIAYENDRLEYASKHGGVWMIEVVDPADIVGNRFSIAVDGQGNPHIAYYDRIGRDLEYASRINGVWTLETVDATGDVGADCSLAIDALGNPHISYFDATAGDLKYAFKSGGIWTLATVATTGTVGVTTSIALDDQGTPRISYYDVTNTDVNYAVKTMSGWIIENPSEFIGSEVGLFASLALDPQGNPGIVCYDRIAGGVRYFSRGSTGGWAMETVDPQVGTLGSISISLKFDANGTAHVSYLNGDEDDLMYASRTSSGWSINRVDADGTVGWGCSMALDAQGNPSISYYDVSQFNVNYTDAAVHLESPVGGERWASGSVQSIRWRGAGPVDVEMSEDGGFTYFTLLSSISENIVPFTVPALSTERARLRITRSSPFSTSDSPGYFLIAPDLVSPWWSATGDATGDVGSYSSLALDAHGSPRISYWDATALDLRYAARNGGAWSSEIVDATGVVGSYTSLALDAQGNPRISYYNTTNGDLKFASKGGGTWATEIVDAGGNVGSHTSLALDSQGNPRISYYDSGLGDLKFASKNGGTWAIETVEATGNVGRYTSLALDAQGNPRISYFDFGNGYLKFASKNGGTWTIEIVDTRGTVGFDNSLALDSQGNPRISYSDATNGNLKYASKEAGAWITETVDAAGSVGDFTSLALNQQGDPRISYRDATNGDLKYASRSGGRWTVEIVDAPGLTGMYTSLALDAQGNPRISYYDAGNGDLKYASAAVEIVSPSPGEIWPVGSSRTVTWGGTGRVDLSLSADGGRTWELIAAGLTSGEHRDLVPHTPSKFAQYRVERAVPRSIADTGLFTIETSVSLLAMLAAPLPEGQKGALISWQTDPGPEDLAGYRLERSGGSTDWRTIASLTRLTSYTDPEGGPGSKYRLFAVNGLGEELWLGEATIRPLAPLAAWPLPYRGGSLTVSFATAGGLGGGTGRAELSVYDVSGRLVRKIDSGVYPAGYRLVTWDGRDAHGREVSPGIYFLRTKGDLGYQRTMKVSVLR